MENYTEYLIKKRFTPGDGAKLALIAFALLFIAASVWYWLGPASALVILAFGGYGAYLLISGLTREYEYTLTNNSLDVDEIIARRRRRRLCSFDTDRLELCARLDNPDKKGEMSRSFAATIQAASSPDSPNAYFAIYDGENGSNLLIFEPNEKIIEAMRLYARSKVFK